MEKSSNRAEKREAADILETYPYVDERGTVLFEVVRYVGKDFLQRRPNGKGGWIWGLATTKRVLYNLQELHEDERDRPVYFVEGEKDVNALHARGYLATCNPGGAGKWGLIANHAQTVLADRNVIVVGDVDLDKDPKDKNYDVGRRHAKEIADGLQGFARSVRTVEAPNPHKDTSDLFFAGGKVEDFVEMGTRKAVTPPSKAQQMAPVLPFDDLWTPEPDAQLIIPGLGIAPGPVHLVTGTWYTGKTLLLATMGLAVASGKWLFGLHQTKRGKWAHFDHEMGRRHMKRYLQRLRAGLGTEIEDLRDRVDVRVLPQLNLCTPGAFEMYCELLDGVSIATIDPLRAAAPGGDENKSEFRQYLEILSQVSERTRCSIVVLHHGGKPGMVETQRRNTGRGTSAIDDASQSKWVLSADEKGAPMLVTHEKSRELTALMDDFYLRIDNTADSVRLVHMAPEEMEQTIEKQRSDRETSKIAKVKIKIREVFMAAGGRIIGTRNEVVQHVGGDRGPVQRAISDMLATGEIKRETKREGLQIVTTHVLCHGVGLVV